MSYMLIDNETGFALRNLPSATWNNGKYKKLSIWTFSSPDKPAAEKAKKQLAEKGFTNVSFVEYNDESELKVDEVAENNKVSKGYIAPRNIEETKKLLGLDDNDPLLKQINHKCVSCTKHCKQNAKAVIYQCTLYDRNFDKVA